MSRVTHMNEFCHAYEWVMSHKWRSHVTQMNECCHTYEWVLSRIWMIHVTMSDVTNYAIHMNESRHTYKCQTAHYRNKTTGYSWGNYTLSPPLGSCHMCMNESRTSMNAARRYSCGMLIHFFVWRKFFVTWLFFCQARHKCEQVMPHPWMQHAGMPIGNTLFFMVSHVTHVWMYKRTSQITCWQ